MHEVPESPKKGGPNPWIVSWLFVLSICLLVVTVTYVLQVADNEKAIASSRAESAHQSSVMQAKINDLAAEVAALRAKQGGIVSNTGKSTAYSLHNLPDSMGQKLAPGPVATSATALEDPAIRKSRLYDEALKAKGKKDFEAALGLYRQIIASYPGELDACVELAKVLAINVGGVTWAEKNHNYLAKLDAESWVKKSSTGLRYKIIEQGGAYKPGASSVVKCRYEGKLLDGVIFDSTKLRNNEPMEFPLGAVIPGWAEGVRLVGLGGKILLYIPEHLAFGVEGNSAIPGRSVLIFEIELIGITN